MSIRSAKIDYTLVALRRQGAAAALRTAAGFIAEWAGRRMYRWEYPTVEWGRDITITGRLEIHGIGGRVVIGDGCTFEGTSGRPNRISVVAPDAVVVIGPGSLLNGVEIIAARRVETGRSCWLATCTIIDTDFHPIEAERRINLEPGPAEPVRIGDRAWVAARALVLKGVEIGEESVVGAGAVVRRSVPPRTLVVGEEQRPLPSGDGRVDAP